MDSGLQSFDKEDLLENKKNVENFQMNLIEQCKELTQDMSEGYVMGENDGLNEIGKYEEENEKIK